MVWGTSVNSLALILKTINLFLPCKFISWKSYQSWWSSKFSKDHISVEGNSSITILYHIIIRPTLNIILKTLLILQKKDTKVGNQNFGYQIWFCTRLEMESLLFPHTEAKTKCRSFCRQYFQTIFFIKIKKTQKTLKYIFRFN